MSRKFLGLLGAAALLAGAWAGSASAQPVFTGGVQTALPIVRPGPGAFTLFVGAVPIAPVNPQFAGIDVGRDDTSPYVAFTFLAAANQLPPPYQAPGGYKFVYRPELDPIQGQLPMFPGNNVDPMSQWVAVQGMENAMRQCRAQFNVVPPGAPYVGFFFFFVNPVTAGTLLPLADEFYKFSFTN